MTVEERDWLIRLINDPPPGSKLAAAKEYGIDLTLLIGQLELTPEERFRELANAQSFLAEFKRAGKQLHP